MIYISERLFRTAHADVLLLEHHQNVCVSTMCREKHVLKIVSCKKKRRKKKKKAKARILQRISDLSWSHDTLLISGLCRLIYICLFRKWGDQYKGSLEAEWKIGWLKYPQKQRALLVCFLFLSFQLSLCGALQLALKLPFLDRVIFFFQ